MYDYRRFADETSAPIKASFRYRWEDSPIGAIANVSLLVNRKLAGRIALTEDKLPECQKDIDALATRGFTSEHTWNVYRVAIEPTLKGKGLGSQLYRAALQFIAKKQGPFYVGPMSCTSSGTTSEEARHVWDSLVRKYPSSGRVIFVR